MHIKTNKEKQVALIANTAQPMMEYLPDEGVERRGKLKGAPARIFDKVRNVLFDQRNNKTPYGVNNSNWAVALQYLIEAHMGRMIRKMVDGEDA